MIRCAALFVLAFTASLCQSSPMPDPQFVRVPETEPIAQQGTVEVGIGPSARFFLPPGMLTNLLNPGANQGGGFSNFGNQGGGFSNFMRPILSNLFGGQNGGFSGRPGGLFGNGLFGNPTGNGLFGNPTGNGFGSGSGVGSGNGFASRPGFGSGSGLGSGSGFGSGYNYQSESGFLPGLLSVVAPMFGRYEPYQTNNRRFFGR